MDKLYVVVGFVNYEGSEPLYASLNKETAETKCNLLTQANEIDHYDWF